MKSLLFALPLVCAMPLASAHAQVPGSYRQSCSEIYMTGNTLHATCKGPNGRIRSSLDVSRCGNQGVGNAYGRLFCGNNQGSSDEGGRGGDRGDRGDRGGYGDGGGRGRGGYRGDDDGGYRGPPPPRYSAPGGYDNGYAPRGPRRYDPDDDE